MRMQLRIRHAATALLLRRQPRRRVHKLRRHHTARRLRPDHPALLATHQPLLALDPLPCAGHRRAMRRLDLRPPVRVRQRPQRRHRLRRTERHIDPRHPRPVTTHRTNHRAIPRRHTRASPPPTHRASPADRDPGRGAQAPRRPVPKPASPASGPPRAHRRRSSHPATDPTSDSSRTPPPNHPRPCESKPPTERMTRAADPQEAVSESVTQRISENLSALRLTRRQRFTWPVGARGTVGASSLRRCFGVVHHGEPDYVVDGQLSP